MLMVYFDPLCLALLRGARAATRRIARVAHFGDSPAPRKLDDPTPTGHRNAGWVQVLDADAERLRGRGRLMLRGKDAHPDGTPAFEARLESFVPAEEPALGTGDPVRLFVETSNEHYPVTVRSIEAEGSAVSVSWPGDELPATLREIGGD